MRESRTQTKKLCIKKRSSLLGAMKESIDIINHRCRFDHLQSALLSKTPSKLSLYSKEYSNLRTKRSKEEKENEPANFNYGKGVSMYENRKKNTHSMDKLPSIHEGSIYKRAFGEDRPEDLIKGKERDSFFLKQERALPAFSEYRKSFEVSPEKEKILGRVQGIPLKDHLSLPKHASFQGTSIYANQFSIREGMAAESKFCIKSKDHIKKKNASLAFSHSEYRKQFEKKSSEGVNLHPQLSLLRQSSHDHYFPSRVSTRGHFESTYKNVYHNAFEQLQENQ